MAKTAFYMRQYRTQKKAAQSKQMQAVQAAEDGIWQRKTEKLVAVDSDGSIVLQKSGGASSVGMTQDEASLIKGTIATHNHPSGGFEIGGTFSPADVSMLDKLELKGARATAAEGTYSLIREVDEEDAFPYGLSVNYESKADSEVAKLTTTRQQLQSAAHAGKISVGEANRQLGEAYAEMNDALSGWLENNASRFGYTYSFAKRK